MKIHPRTTLPLCICVCVIATDYVLRISLSESAPSHDLIDYISGPAARFAWFALVPSVLALFAPARAFRQWAIASIVMIPIAIIFVSRNPVYSHHGFGLLSGNGPTKLETAYSSGEIYAGISAAILIWGMLRSRFMKRKRPAA